MLLFGRSFVITEPVYECQMLMCVCVCELLLRSHYIDLVRTYFIVVAKEISSFSCIISVLKGSNSDISDKNFRTWM